MRHLDQTMNADVRPRGFAKRLMALQHQPLFIRRRAEAISRQHRRPAFISWLISREDANVDETPLHFDVKPAVYVTAIM